MPHIVILFMNSAAFKMPRSDKICAVRKVCYLKKAGESFQQQKLFAKHFYQCIL